MAMASVAVVLQPLWPRAMPESAERRPLCQALARRVRAAQPINLSARCQALPVGMLGKHVGALKIMTSTADNFATWDVRILDPKSIF